MKKIILLGFLLLNLTSFAYAEKSETYTLTIHVENLRNSKGVLQYALYNEDGTLPDEKYEHCLRKQTDKST